MINRIGQVMLYVNDQDQAVRFWTEKVGFVVVAESAKDQEFRWIEIAPAQGEQTSFVLHNKEVVARMEPELNLGTPSIMFFASDLDELYQAFQQKGIKVGQLVNIPGGRVFNFADDEENYFAVMERQ